tara:strand:+ start:3686 stop:3832 length:147 start_codon:yes stop_codon:yes gene_type:complete
MQQLLEMGLGFTVKKFIAHAYKEENGIWDMTSIKGVTNCKKAFEYCMV